MAEDELDGIRRGFGRRLLSTGRIAASAARLAARRVVGASPGATDGKIGDALARELDQMKGMAMKVGQILSYFDGILPDETHAALRRLQTGARPVARATMMQAIEDAFGQPVEALFESLEPEPVAAASIGQVYRGRFEGQDVAVKVQYPGIRDTMTADFARLHGIAKLASLATAVDGQALVRELQERVVEECDYVQEAKNLDAFARAFADDDDVRVPTSIRARTAPTVLTTQWAQGRDFYAEVDVADPAHRNAVAEVLVRFAYRSLFSLGTLNADPHPGNYLFAPDGRVVFLDFGCVRRFDTEFVEVHRELSRVVIDGRRDAFRDAVLATGMVPKPAGFDFDHWWEMLRYQYAPYCTPEFRFTREYLADLSRFSGPSNPNLRRVAIPPAWIWWTRLQFGLHAVLVRLQAKGDFGAQLRRWLDAPLVGLPA